MIAVRHKHNTVLPFETTSNPNTAKKTFASRHYNLPVPRVESGVGFGECKAGTADGACNGGLLVRHVSSVALELPKQKTLLNLNLGIPLLWFSLVIAMR